MTLLWRSPTSGLPVVRSFAMLSSVLQNRQLPLQEPGKHPSATWYSFFVTLCVAGRRHLFGEVTEGKMQLTEQGRVIRECWRALPEKYPHLKMDAYVIMPNHLHGIVCLQLPQEYCLESVSLCMKSFKAMVTRRLRKEGLLQSRLWEKGVHIYVMHSPEERDMLRRYISENPQWWDGNWDDLGMRAGSK